jgi:RNA polymerase sigma-70 factor, ECF subfamily
VSQPTDAERDHALIEKAKQSPEAFGLIFDIYYSKILSYALRRVGDAEAAQDITAEVFSKAFRALTHYRSRGVPFAAWLYRIAGNEVKMFYRRPRKHTSLDVLTEAGFDVPSELREEREQLQELVERDARFARAMAALRTLPMRYQEAIVLRYIEEKEIGEIAQILTCREGSVRSLLSRGLRKLRVALEAPLQQNGGERITTNEAQGILSALK